MAKQPTSPAPVVLPPAMDGLPVADGLPVQVPQLTLHRAPLHALTGLRFVAATWVVIFHTRCAAMLTRWGFPHASHVLEQGKMAVALFFLLSGFILAYTYRGQIVNGMDRRRFWQARFARIWPAYAFSLLIVSFSPREASAPGVWVAALLMVQAWNPFRPELAGAVNFVCWSLSVEAFFYVVFPWAQRWLVCRSAQRQMLCLVVFAALAVLANTAAQTDGFIPYGGVFRFVPLPLIRLPEFLVGVVAGNLFLEYRGRLPGQGRVGGWWTYGGAALAMLVLSEGLTRWSSVVVLPFLIVLLGLAAEKTLLSRVLGSRLLVFGGGISYSMYLLQLAAKYWSRVLLAPTGVGDGLLAMLSMPVLLVAMATGVFLLLEEPSRRVFRRMFARWDEGAGS